MGTLLTRSKHARKVRATCHFRISFNSGKLNLVVLRINSKDSDALQAKLFLLLQTEQYDAALALISENGSEGTGREFEKAYALYRLHRESDAGDVLSNVKGGHGPSDFHSRGIIHLEAQLVRRLRPSFRLRLINVQAYRQSTFQSAFDLYSQLLDTSSSVRRVFCCPSIGS